MKILLTGSIAMDRIMVFPGTFEAVIQPDKLKVLSISVLLNDLKETRGGVGANTAYNLALLGEKPILLGSVGENGRPYMNDLAAHGVDISPIHYSNLPTASFSVITDQDNCQIGGFYPGAMGDASSQTFETWQPEDVFLVIAPHDPQQMKRQVVEAKARNFRLFYDVGQQIANLPAADLKEGVSTAELLIVNDYELGLLQEKTGLTLEEILNQVKVLVVTLGEQGSRLYVDGQELLVPALHVANVLDPTGAGDAFRAGFLYGYIRDWPVQTCAELGSVVASYAIQKVGTQEHSFSRVEIENMYSKNYQGQLTWSGS